MIRRAIKKDIPRLLELLKMVNLVHHQGRPDIFNIGTKYKEEELEELLNNDEKPIFVYVDNNDYVLGYIFTIKETHVDDNILTNIKTLYIDDLCVDENYGRMGIGSALYHYVVAYAKDNGYYNVTLNVWELNSQAKKFYEKLGLKPLKTYLEQKI